MISHLYTKFPSECKKGPVFGYFCVWTTDPRFS